MECAVDAKESRREPTLDRVLLHSVRPDVMYETTLMASTKYGEHAVDRAVCGPRSSRRDMELLELAKRIEMEQEQDKQASEQAQQRTLSTETKSKFLNLDPSILANVSQVPRGRNGARIVDPSIQHLRKHEVDSIDQMKLDMLMQDVTVTRYSYAIATGTGLDFSTSASDAKNPFGRSSTFTSEITDPSKRHGEATEPASAYDERNGMTLHQRAALFRLMQFVQRNDLSAFASLSEKLQSRTQNDIIQLQDFRSAFSESATAFPMTDNEVIHIFMHFDLENIGAIALLSFLNYCQENYKR